MFQHDNARPHVTRICTQLLEAENVPVLPWPVYSPDMSPIEHVWDALDRRVQQHSPVPANILQLCTTIVEEWDNIPQATINILINSMWRCAALHEANGGHTRYWLLFQSCENHSVGTNSFISIDWLPYMNCSSVKSLKLLHLYFCSVHIKCVGDIYNMYVYVL